MIDLDQSVQKLLDFLAKAPRDESGYGWTTGDEIRNATGLEPADINDAVTLLAGSQCAKWLQGSGSHPWQFVAVALTAKGRALKQRTLKASPTAPAPSQSPITVNVRGDFSGLVAGAVSGPTTIIGSQTSVTLDRAAVSDAIDQIKKHRGDLLLGPMDAESLDREIQAVEGELKVESPRRSIVKTALTSIAEVVKGGAKSAATSVIANGIIHLLKDLIASL